jgi:ATPase subunit of ABC transporter with duplicated ATPase domains
MKNAGDRAATSSLAKGRVAQAEKALGRRGQVVSRKLDRVEQASEALGPLTRARGRTLHFDAKAGRKRQALCVQVGPLFGGDRLLLPASDVIVEDGQHVWIQGDNGSGKTTLLEALTGRAANAVFIPQVLEDARTAADLDALQALAPSARGRSLQRLAALGADPLRILESAEPSPGEARKVALALALDREPSILLLDEPTNDLDFASIARLEAALVAWPGALLLVTHDQALAEKVCSEVWRVDPMGLLRTA